MIRVLLGIVLIYGFVLTYIAINLNNELQSHDDILNSISSNIDNLNSALEKVK
jgi:hypothetical protein